MTANKLGGAHVWTLDMDDFSGSFCSAGSYPLVNHLRVSMGDYCSRPSSRFSSSHPSASVDGDFLPVSAGFPPKPTMPPTPATTRDPLADFCRGRPDGLYENAADKTTFLQCFKGITYVQHCQPGLVYMDSCKCCNWP